MIKTIRNWLFKRKVDEEISILNDACWRTTIASAGRFSGTMFEDRKFYYVKEFMRERFPGAFIEIAEGKVTVAKGDLFAQVRV